jgi:predicted RNA-binding protein with PIN domain
VSEHLILIDGYNLILRSPLLRPGPDRTLREARDKLINLLTWAIGGGDARFLVVFDGAEVPGTPERQGRIEVRYSRPPRKADDDLRDLVEDQIERVDRLTVVSSDLEVMRHARAMGATVLIADLFLASVVPPQAGEAPEKPETLSKKDIEKWAEIFRRRASGEAAEDEPAP